MSSNRYPDEFKTEAFKSVRGRGHRVADVAGRSGMCSGIVNMDPSGRFAYVVKEGADTVSQYSIGIDGALIPFTPAIIPADSSPVSIVTSGQWQ